MERLQQCFDEPFSLPDGHTVRIGASMGVARFPEHAEQPAQLVTLADQAMLSGKRAGKGRWVVHRVAA